MSRLDYLARRLALAIFVVIGVLAITFIVSRIVPSDPARLFTGPRASKEKIEETREKFGLNKPIPAQFVSTIGVLQLTPVHPIGQPQTKKQCFFQSLRFSDRISLANRTQIILD